MWDIKEACQATAFLPLTPKGVVTGTFEEMQKAFHNKLFLYNQRKPDVCQNYRKATFEYKETVGLDYKNIMGKTVMHGKNQLLIGTEDKYMELLDSYEATLMAMYNVKHLKHALDKLRLLAKNNDWHGQILFLADHMHEFPKQSLPPLYTKEKIHLDSFTPQVQASIINYKRIIRERSKRAYELNIPEENFSESHIQQLLAENV